MYYSFVLPFLNQKTRQSIKVLQVYSVKRPDEITAGNNRVASARPHQSLPFFPPSFFSPLLSSSPLLLTFSLPHFLTPYSPLHPFNHPLGIHLLPHHVCLVFGAETADPQVSPQSPVPHRFALPHFFPLLLRPILLQSHCFACSTSRLQILNHVVSAICGPDSGRRSEGL